MTGPWFVSRQMYWPDGEQVVEVAGGGLDYANPDMLVSGWPELGEGKEYEDPREALKAAILIRDAWITNLIDRGKLVLSNAEDEDDGRPRVETGHTMGFTMPFCSYPADEELAEWAEKRYIELVKCATCSAILTESYAQHPMYSEDDDPKFCPDDNRYCIEKHYGQCAQCSELLDGDPNSPSAVKFDGYPYNKDPLVFCYDPCKEEWEKANA